MAQATIPPAPMFPPTDQEIAQAEARLSAACDALAAAERAHAATTEAKKDALAELRRALSAWRAIRRQLAAAAGDDEEG